MKFLLVFLGFLTPVFAQDALTINGHRQGQVTRSLIAGRSYIEAELLADAFGAAYQYDAELQTASFHFAGRLLTIRIYEEADRAAVDSNAIFINGQAWAGTAGVLKDNVVYVPLRPIVEAFGSAVYDTGAASGVLVVSPRAKLLHVEVKLERDYERLVLEFQGMAVYESFFNRALNTLQLRFEQADAANAQSLNGTFFQNLSIDPNAGYLDLRLTLKQGFHVESYSVPSAQGFQLVIDVISDAALSPAPQPGSAVLGPALNGTARVVLDPGHGGQDTGLSLTNQTESVLTYQFAERLGAALQKRGINVQLTRGSDSFVSVQERSQQGIGADLFLSIHAANLQPGKVNLYFLGEAHQGDLMDVAIRENVASALENPVTPALRRKLLLGLVPNLALGEQLASELSQTLFDYAAYQAAMTAAVPLAVLEGAAGRGVMIEMNASDLQSSDLPERLADAIVAALASALN